MRKLRPVSIRMKRPSFVKHWLSLDEFDEDVAKLKTAIDDWKSGDSGMPIDQAVDLIRGKVERK